MSTAHSHNERWLPNRDKSDPVMNNDRSKSILNSGLVGNLLQLMFGHVTVRFVIDSFDFAPILGAANNPLEINSRTGSGIDSLLWRIELRVCH